MVCKKISGERGYLGCNWLKLEVHGALTSKVSTLLKSGFEERFFSQTLEEK